MIIQVRKSRDSARHVLHAPVTIDGGDGAITKRGKGMYTSILQPCSGPEIMRMHVSPKRNQDMHFQKNFLLIQ